jgi:hypothetical protein
MSITDQFWQYAEEAILSASYAKPGEDTQGQLELARAWTEAALLERQSYQSPPLLLPAVDCQS